MGKGSIIAACAAVSLAVFSAWLVMENHQLQADLTVSRAQQAGLAAQVESLENNLRSARMQLERFSSSLQEVREQLNSESNLRTTNDLSSQLFGKQPPATSVAPPPGYQSNRPPGSAMDMARQMAEMQANVRYGEFVDSLNLNDNQEAPIRSAITDVFVERVAASRLRSTGTSSNLDLEQITSSAYLRERLSAVLNTEQLITFDNYEAGFLQMQLRNTFAQDVSRHAPELTDSNRELVLDTVVKHLGGNLQEGLNPQADAISETQRQLMALTMARRELLDVLDEEQMMEASKFLNQVQSGMVQSQTMNEGADSH